MTLCTPKRPPLAQKSLYLACLGGRGSGKKESSLGKGAVAVSVLAGSWRSLGPALLGASRQSGEYHWSSIRNVHIDEGSRVLTLTDDWHAQLRLYCTPETFAPCVSIVEDHVARENIRRS